MTDGDLIVLFRALQAEFRSVEILWQLGLVALCLLLARLIADRLEARLKARSDAATGETTQVASALGFGRGGLRRIAFPVTALVLVFITRAIARHYISVDLINVVVPLMLSMAAVRIVVYMLRHAFRESRWLATSERVVALSIWIAVVLHLAGASAPLIAALEGVQFSIGNDPLNLWMIVRGAFMVVTTIVAALWIAGLIERRLEQTQIDSSLRVVLVRVAKALLTLVAVLFSLSKVGIDVTALSVFGGALGVGLGLGLQKIASNYVSGFIILLDRSIRLGDMVTVDANTSGVVKLITTRYTVVRTANGTEVIVPNEYFVSSLVQNQSYTDRQVRLTCKVQVAYSTDIDMLMPKLVALALAHPRVLKTPEPMAFLLGFGENGLDLELGFWIEDPEAGMRNIQSELNLEILRMFQQEGVEIPYPQREMRARPARNS